MSSAQIGHILGVVTTAWFFALAGVVLFQIAAGKVSIGRMFAHEAGGAPRLDRLQMFVATLFGLGFYAAKALNTEIGAETMPDLPQSLLWALGGSQGVYLAAKLNRTFEAIGGSR